MNCPFCGSRNTRVWDSRPRSDNTRRRRYSCNDCGERFTTYEQYEKVKSERDMILSIKTLLAHVMSEFEDYLDFMDVHPESEEEVFKIVIPITTIVRQIMLDGTGRSGMTSTIQKCNQLGLDTDIGFDMYDRRDLKYVRMERRK